MSSQGANTTTLSSGYLFDPNSIRDSSDVTRRLREKMVLIETVTFSPTKAPEPKWLKYGNGYRLALLNGNFKCTACTGNAFSLNGVS